eukprot:272678-Rhodomonas_salina.2
MWLLLCVLLCVFVCCCVVVRALVYLCARVCLSTPVGLHHLACCLALTLTPVGLRRLAYAGWLTPVGLRRLTYTSWHTPDGLRMLAFAGCLTPVALHRLPYTSSLPPVLFRRLAYAVWHTPFGLRRLAYAGWLTPVGGGQTAAEPGEGAHGAGHGPLGRLLFPGKTDVTELRGRDGHSGPVLRSRYGTRQSALRRVALNVFCGACGDAAGEGGGLVLNEAICPNDVMSVATACSVLTVLGSNRSMRGVTAGEEGGLGQEGARQPSRQPAPIRPRS